MISSRGCLSRTFWVSVFLAASLHDVAAQSAAGASTTATTGQRRRAPRVSDLETPAPTPKPGEVVSTPAIPLGAQPVEKSADTTSSKGAEKKDEKTKASDASTSASEEPVVTRHTLKLSSGALDYTATAAFLPLKNENGDTEAKVFHMFYALGDKPEGHTTRPLVFLFNGGPGSSSIWLHMGAFGPRRARLRDDGTLPPPPYELVDNEETLLRDADLVFVDPVGSGFSRPSKPEKGKDFWGARQDLESMSEFVRLFLVRNSRMRSALFLAGESYGTFRAAGLTNKLLDKNIALNGIVLVSTILDFRPQSASRGNEVPYAIYLPTFTAAAWVHKKLPADLQRRSLNEALREAEQWAMTSYTLALVKGAGLAPAERDAITTGLARYTGLSPQFITDCDQRIDEWRFRKELLRQTRRSLSAYDARLLAIEPHAIGDAPDYDPLLNVMGAPFTMLFNDYVRNELGYKTDAEYVTISGKANGAWDYGNPREDDFMDMTENLRRAMSRNQAMRVLVARGLYDFATPYFAAAYTFGHLGLDPAVQANVETTDYEGGHMMYIDKAGRQKLTNDVSGFIGKSLGR
ncbi:MAG: S10 family serine carboxypeptidase-like protein [Candidatus Sumerlaeaceae bacterium]